MLREWHTCCNDWTPFLAASRADHRSAEKDSTRSMNLSGCSSCGKWPVSSHMTSWEEGIKDANRWLFFAGTTPSCLPWTISTCTGSLGLLSQTQFQAEVWQALYSALHRCSINVSAWLTFEAQSLANVICFFYCKSLQIPWSETEGHKQVRPSDMIALFHESGGTNMIFWFLTNYVFAYPALMASDLPWVSRFHNKGIFQYSY